MEERKVLFHLCPRFLFVQRNRIIHNPFAFSVENLLKAMHGRSCLVIVGYQLLGEKANHPTILLYALPSDLDCPKLATRQTYS